MVCTKFVTAVVKRLLEFIMETLLQFYNLRVELDNLLEKTIQFSQTWEPLTCAA